MNCATHSDVTAVAYCRTCGKPLCDTCSRSVQGVIYCESCLAERLHGAQPAATGAPAAGFVPPPPPPPIGSSGPNPALAGLLSIFPGVGSVYNGQYAKGLAYMGIFVLLILGIIHISWIFGLALGFFVLYQFVDAIQSAKAMQMGKPAPDPLGIGQTFSPGQKVDASKIPLGAVILIVLGGLFLLQNVMNFEFSHFWPLLLIGLGLWLGAGRLGLMGGTIRSANPRTLMGPVILVTLGTLFLIGEMDGPGFHRTWPVLLLVIGLMKLLGHGDSGEGYSQPPDANPGTGPSSVPPPPSEVNHG